MRRFVPAALIVFAIFAVASGQKSVRQSGDVEREIMQVERRISEAIRLKDVAALEANLADEFILTEDTGSALSKAQFINRFRTSDGEEVPTEEVPTEIDEVRVRVYGSVAVLNCRRSLVDVFIIGDYHFSGQWRETSVFVKRQGRWRLTSSQQTLIRRR